MVQTSKDKTEKFTTSSRYRDTSEWKPFHHDAAAMKPDKVSTTKIHFNKNLDHFPIHQIRLYIYNHFRNTYLKAINEFQARTQNMTVGVSFGAERDAAFEHATNRCTISMPQVILEILYKYVMRQIFDFLKTLGNIRYIIILLFFSPMAQCTHLGVMLTFYGGMESVNFPQKCSIMKGEYLSFVGGGVKVLTCSHGGRKINKTKNNWFSNNIFALWMKHLKTKQM